MGLVQMHREANLNLPLKGQMSTYDNSFSKFGRPLVPDDLCKDSAIRHSRFWRRRFLKVFTIYGHGRHLGQRTATILAIFCFPTLRWLHMKFEQTWLRGFRGEVVRNSQQFFPFKCMRFSPMASSVLEKKILKGFYHIWAWRPSWSTDQDYFSNLSFPHPKEAPYEI